MKDVFQPSYHHFIATDGSVEVDQRLLQLHQLQEIFVADAFFQLFFGGGHIVVYLFQILQEPDGGRVDDSQNQIQFIVDDYVLPACVLDEVRYQLRVVIADRNDDSVIGDNADGHGDERHAALVALHRDAEDGQQPVVFCFRTRALVHVGYVFQE